MANQPTIGPDDAAALLRMQATLFMILEAGAEVPEPKPEEPKPEPKAERRKPLALKPEAE